jgi:5'-nucleotidase
LSITKQNQSVDLVVSGVNEGSNLGPLVYTLSGTLGAAYVAVGRGIPAIAVSGQNSTKVDYKDWDPEDESAVGESPVMKG